MPRKGSTAIIGEEEEPCYQVHPGDNVYSYFMFITPTEKKREGKYWTTDVVIAYILVMMSFFAQGLIITTIFNQVVLHNLEWQDGVIKTAGALNLFEAPAWETGEKCNDGGSLCFMEDGIFTCAPPSVQLMGRWEELDSDGDGVWTREEVTEARERLKCKYAVDPVEVFDVLHTFLLKRQSLLWLHPEVVAGSMIHKTYFTYAMGDLIMCSYRNEDMCPNLLERGIFDAALKYGTAPRVGTTIDSALDYCRELLRDGGACEASLPSTYSVWRIDSAQQCKAKRYEKITYAHPNGKETKSLLSVDYEAREDFERVKTLNFMAFKGVIIFLWLLAMTYEVKQIIVRLTWVFRFPTESPDGQEVEEIPDPTTLDPESIAYVIHATHPYHKASVGILAMGRLIMIVLLAVIGVFFLGEQTKYMALLVDGIALMFIVEIEYILYRQVLRDDIKRQTESISPMRVKMYGWDWLNRHPAITDAVWLALMFLIVLGANYLVYSQISVPVSHALECTCLSQGDKCFEATEFSPTFWDKYWHDDVPAIYGDVQRLKGSAGSSAHAPGGAPASAPTSAPVSAHIVRPDRTLLHGGSQPQPHRPVALPAHDQPTQHHLVHSESAVKKDDRATAVMAAVEKAASTPRDESHGARDIRSHVQRWAPPHVTNGPSHIQRPEVRSGAGRPSHRGTRL